jgi:hypothetical protein
MGEEQLPCSKTRRHTTDIPVGLGYCTPPTIRQTEGVSHDVMQQLSDLAHMQMDLERRVHLREALTDSGLPAEVCRDIRARFKKTIPDIFTIDETIEDAQAIHAAALREMADRPVSAWEVNQAEADLERLAAKHAGLCGGMSTANFLSRLGHRAGAGLLGDD